MNRLGEPAGASLGFSLLEVLITLAITSIVSALIFSSLTTQVTQAEAVRRSTDRAFDQFTSRGLAELIVSRTVPAWADEPESAFKGGQDAFSGRAAVDLFGQPAGLQAYRLALRPGGETSLLDIELAGTVLRTYTFPAGARFRYLGPSGTWRDSWPVPVPQAASLAELEAGLMDVGLPRMVALWDEEGLNPLGLELRLDNTGALPVRAKDLVSETPP